MELKNLLIIAILAFLGWYFLVRVEDPENGASIAAIYYKQISQKIPSLASPPSPTTSIPRFWDENAERIFSPLDDERGKEIDTTELSEFRKNLPDLKSQAANENERLVYAYSDALAQKIQKAIAERNAHAKSLADLRHKNSQPFTGVRKSDPLTEKDIQKAWAQKELPLRQEIQKAYDFVKNLENQ